MSDRPLGPATLEERTDDIRAVMDAAGSERAFIFGTSEGGSMACVFAATDLKSSRSTPGSSLRLSSGGTMSPHD